MCLTDTQQCALRRSVTGRVHSVHHHESTRLCFLCMVGQCPVQQHLGVTLPWGATVQVQQKTSCEMQAEVPGRL